MISKIEYVSYNITKSLVLGEKYKILPTNDIITIENFGLCARFKSNIFKNVNKIMWELLEFEEPIKKLEDK